MYSVQQIWLIGPPVSSTLYLHPEKIIKMYTFHKQAAIIFSFTILMSKAPFVDKATGRPYNSSSG
jgi:hypothetical protein